MLLWLTICLRRRRASVWPYYIVQEQYSKAGNERMYSNIVRINVVKVNCDYFID